MTDDARLRAEFLKYGELEDPAAKTGFLASLRKSDPSLVSRLERLIEAAAIDDSFLEVPAVRSWRRLLTESSDRQMRTETDAAALLAQLQQGTSGELRFGSYELRRLIKTSSEAIVFEGYDPQVQRRVALKCLMPSSIEQPERRHRILSEARSLARVQDPHVLGVLALLEQGDLRAILLPWIQGPTLEMLLLERLRLPLERAIRISQGLVQGVMAVHRAGIVHRDLKPSNVVLDEEADRPVIVDFGLACDDSDLDEVMLLCGTPLTMAPELIRGGRPSPATDRFALGCILYQLFTGVNPFRGDKIEEVFQRILELDVPPPTTLCPSMPLQIEQALLSLLEKDPEKRADSLNPIRDALLQWSTEIETGSMPSSDRTTTTDNNTPRSSALPHSVPPRPRSQKRLGISIGVVLIGLMIAAMSGWVLMRESIPPYQPTIHRSVPDRPADLDLHWNTDDSSPFIVSTQNVVLNREKTRDHVRYWRPSEAGQWGEIQLRIPCPDNAQIEYASLDATIEVFGILDLSAQATLDVRGLGQSQWLRVGTRGPGESKQLSAGFAMDVTDLCRETGGVEVRARLFATRDMYNPGPDDPIGPASAQFLRDGVSPEQDRGTLCLKIWEKEMASALPE